MVGAAGLSIVAMLTMVIMMIVSGVRVLWPLASMLVRRMCL